MQAIIAFHTPLTKEVKAFVAQSLRLFATPWIVAHQAPLSMGFPRQEYWNGLPFSSPGDLPDPGIKPQSSALQADSLPLSHQRRKIKQEPYSI